MATRLRVLRAAVFFSLLLAAAAYAQEPTPPTPAPAPANLAYVEGAVDLVQDGVTGRADPPVMLLEGDVLRTRNGRAEVVFGDGTLLHLSEDGELEVLGPEHLRLVGGRAILRVSHAAQPYQIDTPASSVRLETQGEYTVATDRAARLEVAVARGAATIDAATPWTIEGGQALTLTAAGSRPTIQSFNSARWDAFAEWSYERANGFTTSYSAARLPYELRPYAPVFDRYGRWDYVAPYGHVWFPSVAIGWRPYFDGSWSFTRFGWTWFGRDRWAWPTHHFGRWGFRGSSWYWIPAKVWAPAWVSWSVARGYVGWAPLGWDNRPAIGLGRRPDHPAYWPDYSPWRGWTVVKRDHFGPRQHVGSVAIDGTRLDAPTRDALAAAVPRFPVSNDIAVPRGTSREPGTAAGAERRGDVRRPDRVYPSAGATADPAARGLAPAASPPADRAVDRVRRPDGSQTPGDGRGAGSGAQRPGDDPSYAPPRSWSSGESRPGSSRRPGARPAPRDESAREPATRTAPDGDTSRGAPVARPAPQGEGSRRGAVARPAPQGEGSRAPQAGSSRGRSAPRTAPPASRPSGAVERGSRPSSPGQAGAAAPQSPRRGAVRRPPGGLN